MPARLNEVRGSQLPTRTKAAGGESRSGLRLRLRFGLCADSHAEPI